MKSHKTKNYEIIDIKGKLTKDIIKKCSFSFNKNKRFFKKNCDFFKIYISHTEKDFKKRSKKFYQPWVKGVSLKGKIIVIRVPKLFRESYKKYKGTAKFEMLLTHEINHIYSNFLNLYKGAYWLTEGLAMYVAGQIPGKTYKGDTILNREKAKKLLFYKLRYKKLCPEMYIVHYYATKYLTKRFGKNKFLRFIDSHSKNMKKIDFEKKFKKIFEISYDSFIEDFIGTL
ncbi:hypothetical protein GF386_02625 [Candidatus Pacearchaeota archaeon]|nr:hypothetical protein [Candidatus Pacearchaeota archaeon]MBD3283043.1 hypothetical protein [Candidatus Pacearchaeota archaeon]